MKRRAARAVALAALALSVVVVRVVWSSHTEWRAAEAASSVGHVHDAVDAWGRAARLYAPGNPWSTGATHRLADAARAAEKAGDTALALAAWRELRASCLGTRSFYTPHRALLDEANDRIAQLAAATEAPSLAPGASEAERARWHAERLARDEMPSVGWSIVALLGLCAWVGAALGFAFDGLDAEDRLRRDRALAWGLGVAAGFVAFLVGLASA